MKVYAISGIKNSGKTTLICSILPLLRKCGIRTAVIKHDGHDFEADVPGRDSYRHREAGAVGTAVFSSEKFMLIKDRGEDDSDEQMLRELVDRFADVDLVLLEGFKSSTIPKLEIVRKENSITSVCSADTLEAVVTDMEPEDFYRANPDFPKGIPLLNLNQPQDIVYFLVPRIDLADEHLPEGRPADKTKIWAHTKVVLAKDEDFFGPGVWRLLKFVAETGSIAAAADTMQISYSKSWKMIKKLEKETGYTFVRRTNGGKNGGNSQLTREAELFVERYEQMTSELRRVNEQLFEKYFHDFQNLVPLEESADEKSQK